MTIPERLAADVAKLTAAGFTIEVLEEGSRYYVVFRNFDSSHFNPAVVDRLMVMADYQYNQSKIDMFYTSPTVFLPSGQLPRNADQFEEHCGLKWQRWSYHYTWDPTKHDLTTHIEVVRQRLVAGE